MEYYQNCFILATCYLLHRHNEQKQFIQPCWSFWVCLFMFLGWIIYLYVCVYVLFYLGQLSHFCSCFGACVTNLNEPPSSLLLSPHYCGFGAGSMPLRAIVNKKQCETRGSLCCWSSTTEYKVPRVLPFPKRKLNYSFYLKAWYALLCWKCH